MFPRGRRKGGGGPPDGGMRSGVPENHGPGPYLDHQPPHLHARYQDHEVIVQIESGLVKGVMAKGPLRLVLAWTEIHHQELMDNWKRARERKPLESIPPLP